MLESLIRYSVRNKVVIALLTLALIAWGSYSLIRLPLDAVPDITNNQVQVVTISPALAPQEMEQYVTFPVELAVANLQGVEDIRSISRYGLSVVTIIFDEDIPTLHARQLVTEQLQAAADQIPDGFGKPELMPITTGLGEIYQYLLKPKPGYEHRYSPMELRTIQDWIVKRYMAGVPGVVEISSFGGFLRQIEVSVDPDRLRAVSVTLEDLHEALASNNQNAGGSYIEQGPDAFYIRAEGLVRTPDEVAEIVIATRSGLPIRVREVAEVREGYAPRVGAMTSNGQGEALGGITLMFKGANSNAVVEAVKERVQEVQGVLPEGLVIEPYLDRSALVARTIDTVRTNLIEGGLIVIFVLVLLLGNLRGGLVVASVIPLSMLFAAGMMNLFGVSANLMSLGAIDFGLIVDGAVIIVESVVHALHVHGRGRRLGREEMDREVEASSVRIMRSAVFGEMIILMVYLPILTLEGIEGKMFIPMAQTVAFAILGALILSLTYVPMMAALVLPRKLSERPTFADRLMGWLARYYRTALQWAMRRRALVLGLAVALLAASGWIFSRMGGEFIPSLDEGDMAMQMSVHPGSSLSHSVATATRAESMLLAAFPDEIKRIVSKIGTAEVPTDPMSVEDMDVMIAMHPRENWKRAESREEMADRMKEVLQPLADEGVSIEFTQPIELRFNELLTGSKADIAVRIFGSELEILADQAERAAAIIRTVQGAADVKVDRTEGFPQIVVKYRRDALARYGLSVAEINRTVEAAFAGSVAGQVFESEKRFDLVVRLNPAARSRLEDVRSLFVRLPAGGQVPLEAVADIRFEEGPLLISRSKTKRQITIGVNVRGRDVESLVQEIEAKLNQGLKLPPGYSVMYGGEFENLQSARERLSIAVPGVLLLIFALLFLTFGSLRQALMIFSAIPFAAVGGIWALWLRGMPFSISAGVGFIALFGVAVLNGIVMIGYINYLEQTGMQNLMRRVVTGALTRLRPVIMTAAVASLGFLPMALSRSAGAEVQRPLATVVIGGLVSSTLLTLIVLPVLYTLTAPGQRRRRPNAAAPAAVLLMLLLAGGSLRAQPAGLDSALARMEANHPDLLAGRLAVQEIEASRMTAYDLPAFRVQWQRGQINTLLNDNYFGLEQDLGQPLVWQPQRRLIRQSAAVQAEALAQRRRELRAELTRSWLEWVWTWNRVQLQERQAALLDSAARIAEARQTAGSAPQLDRLSARRRASTEQLRSSALRAELAGIEAALRALAADGAPVQPAAQPLRAAGAFLEASAAALSQPALGLYEQWAALRQQEIAVERARLSPGLSLGYFNQQIEQVNGFQGLSLSLSVPLWFAPQQARIQAARLRSGQADAQLQSRRLALDAEIFRLRTDASRLRSELARYEAELLPQAEAIEQQALIRYRSGETDFVYFVFAAEESLAIRQSYLDALMQYYRSLIHLISLYP
ncbi:MAG: CusA/CzcA family heavy metal efflux RND transporter [Bacteroidia bacterium]|nr:CusA/CzcA family heavy metal efflux RND transporter [Bacteroidia bacterium]